VVGSPERVGQQPASSVYWDGSRPAIRGQPEMYVANGCDDRLAAGDRLLAEIFSEEKVFKAHGGHDWKTWNTLRERLLLKAPLASVVPA
jgi:hypothetical protein